jgi:transcriptional regulator with XRE-family HTH domain
MTTREAVAKRLLYFCKERKITPNKLSTMSGVIQSTLNKILSGKSSNPKILTIKYFCDGLNITLKDFFDNDIFNNLED